MMDEGQGVKRFDSADYEAVVDAAMRDGYRVFVLRGERIATGDDFFEAVRQTFPLNPPLHSNDVWDALNDSLWTGLFELPSDRIAIVWVHSDVMKRAAPDDYLYAEAIVAELPQTLAHPQYTAGRPKTAVVFLGVDRVL